MKTAIVYYSMSGNCEYTAKKIAAELDADLIRLIPETAYPDSGAKKFLWGGKSAMMGEAPALKPYTFDAAKYDRIIFGFPVWAANPTPPLRTFINENRDAIKGKKIAAFTCYMGGSADKALKKLRAMLGVNEFEAELALIDPKDKPTPQKNQEIKGFCNDLL